MKNFSETQGHVFADIKNISSSLSKISSIEELLTQESKIDTLKELFSFLKVSNRYNSPQNEDIPLIIVDKSSVPENQVQTTQPTNENYIAEEEVIFTNQLNGMDDREIAHLEIQEDVLEEEAEFNNQLNEMEKETTETSQNNFMMSQDSFQNENNTDNEEKQHDNYIKHDNSESYDNSVKKSVEVENYHHVDESLSENEDNFAEEDQDEKQQEEKKFKLANIKGLKKIESLFDDEMIEEQGQITNSESNYNTTPNLESTKQKPEFKLDLNDKIAFSKMLFGGSQTEMNDTIRELNQFDSLDKAKEYLSDLYYEKNWEKVDEYAQRLWSLVENKFL